MNDWYNNHENLRALYVWLRDHDCLDSENFDYFLEKPWKWEPEWKTMQAETSKVVPSP